LRGAFNLICAKPISRKLFQLLVWSFANYLFNKKFDCDRKALPNLNLSDIRQYCAKTTGTALAPSLAQKLSAANEVMEGGESVEARLAAMVEEAVSL